MRPLSSPEPWLPALDAACAAGALDTEHPAGGESRRDPLMHCLRALEWLGYDLTELTSLSDIHLQALARHWLHIGLPEPKRNARLLTLHAFIAGSSLRPPRNSVENHLQCAQTVLSACRAADRLCWSAVGIEVDGVLTRIASGDPYVGMQLRLQRLFDVGLGAVLTLRPHEADRGDHLVVLTHGGARTRRRAVDTPEKRAALDAARRLAPYPGAALHAPWTPPCDLLNRYYTECFAAGFSMRAFQIQAPSIRNENAFSGVLEAALLARTSSADEELSLVCH